MSERPCTCHPDDNPPAPCARKYALSECRLAAREALTRIPELDREAVARIIDPRVWELEDDGAFRGYAQQAAMLALSLAKADAILLRRQEGGGGSGASSTDVATSADAQTETQRAAGQVGLLLTGPDDRGWVPPFLHERIRNNLLTDAWLAQVINAYDLSARSELDAARRITPDTWDRRKRIKRHQGQAYYYALHVAAFRELLLGRQRAAALSSASPPLSPSVQTEGGEP